MNTRFPYFNVPPPVLPANTTFNTSYPPPPFNPSTPPPSTSPNWNTPNPNVRNGWKRTRNWNGQCNVSPYTVPKKTYNNRFNYNRSNGMNHTNGWNNKGANLKDSREITDEMIPGIIANKKKRKPMSKSYPTTKWDENDATIALSAEKHNAKFLTNQSLIIRFPDPPLNKDMVKEFHTDIENVHFPQPSTPRYCYAHLKEGTNLEEVVNKIEKIPFGQGFLKVELKRHQDDQKVVTVQDIDPYTLYVGNLPMNITKAAVYQHFSTSARIDIGYAMEKKNSRYAFVRFDTAEKAIEAYRRTVNLLMIDSRSTIVRFRRINGVVGLPGENKAQSQQKTNQTPIVTKEPSTSVVETDERSDVIEPDLSLIKEEPLDSEDQDMKSPPHMPFYLQSVERRNESPYIITNIPDPTIVKREKESITEPIVIKQEKENIPDPTIVKHEDENMTPHINEDEIDEEDEEDNFDASNDNFMCKNEVCLEDECDDAEDDDDYDDDEEYMGIHLNGADTYLPGDDDEDIFND